MGTVEQAIENWHSLCQKCPTRKPVRRVRHGVGPKDSPNGPAPWNWNGRFAAIRRYALSSPGEMSSPGPPSGLGLTRPN